MNIYEVNYKRSNSDDTYKITVVAKNIEDAIEDVQRWGKSKYYWGCTIIEAKCLETSVLFYKSRPKKKR